MAASCDPQKPWLAAALNFDTFIEDLAPLSSLLSFIILYDLYSDVNIANIWQKAYLCNTEIPYFELQPFSRSNISKCFRGGHLSTVFVVKIIISCWKYIFEFKTFCFVKFIPMFPNSYYSEMNTYYSRIYHTSASFSGPTFWEWPQGCRVWITIRC